MRAFLESYAGQLAVVIAGLVLFSAVVIACAAVWPANDKLYALFAGILGNFNGSLMTFLKMRSDRQPPTA